LKNVGAVHSLDIMTREIPVTQARDELADLVNRVAFGHERVILTRHSKPVAALVSAEDLDWLEQRSQERINLTAAGPSSGLGLLRPSADPEQFPIAAQQTERAQPRDPTPPARSPRATQGRRRPRPDLKP
jgi:prevent-host-death family protein